MAKTQPMSEGTARSDDGIILAKKTEIMEAVDLQNRLAKKMAKNSERRKKAAQMQEMTAQNKTIERIDFVEFVDRHYKHLHSGVSIWRYKQLIP